MGGECDPATNPVDWQLGHSTNIRAFNPKVRQHIPDSKDVSFDNRSYLNKSCQFLIKTTFERVRLSPEAVADFQEEGCPVSTLTTP